MAGNAKSDNNIIGPALAAGLAVLWVCLSIGPTALAIALPSFLLLLLIGANIQISLSTLLTSILFGAILFQHPWNWA